MSPSNNREAPHLQSNHSAMSTNENKQDRRALKDILASFNATSLGEGDINAGTNLLVVKAITLSNLSRTGCGIQPSKLNRMKAGCSLLVSGALSSSHAVNDVVIEVGTNQNNLTAQLRRLIGDKVAEAHKKGLKAVEFPSGPGANPAENALFQLEQKDSLIPCEPQEQWAEALKFPPNPRIDDLAARPKILVTAKGPKDLDKQLCGLHGNRPLVILGLNEPADASAYADTCNALLNGPFPVGDGGETVVANLLVTDAGNVLARIAPQADDKSAWLGRMVWLVDGTAGPDAVENVPEQGKFHVSDTGARFGEALNAVLAKRLDNHNAGTEVHDFNLAEAQIRWVAYLKKMETRLPGITGTARGLLPTLAFGLIELANAPNCKQLAVTPDGVEALGRWIIERMANARAEMLYSADLERRMKIAQKIFFKVAHGRLSDREIYRPLNVQADLCRELLWHMEADSMVRLNERKWEHVEGATFSDSLRNRMALA